MTSFSTVADAAARVPVDTVTCSWLTPSESSMRAWLRRREGGVGAGDRGSRRGEDTREMRGKRRGGKEKHPRGMLPSPLLPHASR